MHECTDLWEKNSTKEFSNIVHDVDIDTFKQAYMKVSKTSVGDVYFPAPATNVGEGSNDYRIVNMHFTDGNKGFKNN